MNGKGRGPEKGLNHKKYSEGHSNIDWRTEEQKELDKQAKKKKTSAQWLHSEEFKGTIIHEPKGWDNVDWEEDFHKKKITRDQFIFKLAVSVATLSGSMAVNK